MRWFLYVGAAVVVLVLLVVVIGLMLPRAHRATRMARFKQPPEAIFAAIVGPQDWRPGIRAEELPAEGGVRRWREQSRHGAITFEEAACDPPRLYRARIADKSLPFSGTWTWEITATEGGCTCRIVEEGEVGNPVFRFVGQLVVGYTKTMDGYLDALGKKFKEGVKIED